MKTKTQFLVITAMFTAVISVLSIWQIPTPMGVPFTLQTFAIALCGFVLEEKAGTASAALYVLIGFIGVPVYTGMKAGPGVLFGPTGGYLLGFILMAFICGLTFHFKNRAVHALLALLGLSCCHILGVIQYNLAAEVHSLYRAAMAASVPFLLKDLLSLAGAYIAALAIRRALRKNNWLYCSSKQQNVEKDAGYSNNQN